MAINYKLAVNNNIHFEFNGIYVHSILSFLLFNLTFLMSLMLGLTEYDLPSELACMNKMDIFNYLYQLLVSNPNESIVVSDSIAHEGLKNPNITIDIKNDFCFDENFDPELLDYLSNENSVELNYFALDKENNITKANPNAILLLSASKDFLTLTNFLKYLSKNSTDAFTSWKTRIFSDDNLHSCKITIINFKKTIIHLDLIGKTIKNSISGKNETLVIALKNSIENDNLSTYISDQQQSILTSKFAHELYNPLSVVLNYVRGCVNKIESKNYSIDDILTALKESIKQSVRANEIILALKNIQFSNHLSLKSISINTLLLDIIDSDIITEYNFPVVYRDSKLPNIKVDEMMIKYVIYALLKNSAECLRDSNTEDGIIIIETNRINKNFLELCVIDNGPGFSTLYSDQIFDPHFTTKSYAAGMGLPICRSIVNAHNGTITASLIESRGACFRIKFPI
jgi:nitrogen-specific signal transduction histidine kinase